MPIIDPFGDIDGVPVQRITLGTAPGPKLRIITYGARLTELWVPDRNGNTADIVLGHDDLAGYIASTTYLGATCGRFANRIAGARLMLDGRQITLDANEGAGHLHGGRAGFDRKIWDIAEATDRAVTLTAVSPDGEMGYPGRLALTTRYALDDADRLWITMEATTDAPTVVNMAHHSYFNMAGHASGSVMGQHLTLGATHYTPVNAALIPTGEILSVSGTAFDFTAPRAIRAGLPSDQGFDHNLCLTEPIQSRWGAMLRFCATACDPASGRNMQIWTTEPGVQFYTGGYLDGAGPGKAGAAIAAFSGFALETQTFPDTPNKPQFPSAQLNPDGRYRHLMAFDFTPA
jgi:aldose 1-epimerase